jgi:hypothetical protein
VCLCQYVHLVKSICVTVSQALRDTSAPLDIARAQLTQFAELAVRAARRRAQLLATQHVVTAATSGTGAAWCVCAVIGVTSSYTYTSTVSISRCADARTAIGATDRHDDDESVRRTARRRRCAHADADRQHAVDCQHGVLCASTCCVRCVG